jgi:hypothetical protein
MNIKRFNQINENNLDIPKEIIISLNKITNYLKQVDFITSSIEEDEGLHFEFTKKFKVNEEHVSQIILDYLNTEIDNFDRYENGRLFFIQEGYEYNLPLIISINTDDYNDELEMSIWLNDNVMQKNKI